jgi:hypothetical protein
MTGKTSGKISETFDTTARVVRVLVKTESGKGGREVCRLFSFGTTGRVLSQITAGLLRQAQDRLFT